MGTQRGRRIWIVKSLIAKDSKDPAKGYEVMEALLIVADNAKAALEKAKAITKKHDWLFEVTLDGVLDG